MENNAQTIVVHIFIIYEEIFFLQSFFKET